jgi:hypothetical protein
MRKAESIQVQQAIVHVIDTGRKRNEPEHDGPERDGPERKRRQKAAPKLVKSDVELALDGGPELRSYLEGLVRNASHDAAAMEANFSDAAHATARACYDLLADPRRFIPISQLLADGLYKASLGVGRVKPGSLVVCRYSTVEQDGVPLLALIKVDLTGVLTQHVRKTGDRQEVRLEFHPDGLPTLGERLQKAALVQPLRGAIAYHLLVLDRLAVRGAARYFTTAFLNAVPRLTPAEETKDFYARLVKAHELLTATPETDRLYRQLTSVVPVEPEELPILTPRESDDFRQRVPLLMQDQTVDTKAWVDALPYRPAAKQVLLGKLGERQFELDPTVAADLVGMIRFRGDYGVAFEMEANHRHEVILEEETVRRGDVTVKRLVLEVPNLQWILE